jgi:hypothetical protein
LQGEVERLILQRQARKDALDIYESNQRMAYTGEQIKNAQELRVSRAAQEGRMNAFQGEMRDLHTPSIGEPGQVGLSPDLAVPPTAMTSEAESNPMAVPGKVMNSLWRTGAWRDPEANQMANAMIRLNVPQKAPPQLREVRASTGELFLVNDETGSAHPLKQADTTAGQWTVEKLPNGVNTGYLRSPDGKYHTDPNQKQAFDAKPFDKNGDGILDASEYAAALTAFVMGGKGAPYIGMRVDEKATPAAPGAPKVFEWDRTKGDFK